MLQALDGGGSVRLSKHVVRECFGKKASITSLLFGGYKVKTRSGGSVIVTATEFKKLNGGNDIYEGVARLAKAMSWPPISRSRLADPNSWIS